MADNQQSVIPNPIIPGFNPDPTLCRVGDDYFLATSTFEYFPGVPIYHSRDLVNWRVIGHALNRPSQLMMRRTDPGGGIYAPSLRFHKGRYYLSTCCVYSRAGYLLNEARGFYVSTDNIFDETTWSDPIYFDSLGIDQDLFFDDDDRVYLTVSRLLPYRKTENETFRAVIWGTEIDLATGDSLHRPVLLRESLHSQKCAEGPHIYKKDGWYYLLVAEGGNILDHQVRMARSKNPLGPYEEPPEGMNPFLFNGHHHPDVQSTGHADLIQDQSGNWWAFFLAVRTQVNGRAPLGRECWLTPVVWDENEWPVFNAKKPVELQVITSLLPAQATFTGWIDQFTSNTLDRTWYHVRTPQKTYHSLTARPGSLALQGNGYSISDVEAPVMIVKKQTHLTGVWTTELDFDPSTGNEEAGTAVFWSCFAYAAIVVRKGPKEGERIVSLRWTDPECDEYKEIEIETTIAVSGPIFLQISAQPTSYTMSYRIGQHGEPVVLGAVSTAVLEQTRPFDSPYTGTHFGIFAQGREGFLCADTAYFSYVSFSC